MTTPPFVHLRVHSEYSMVDGLVRIEDLIDAVDAHKGMCVALTDHCNLFGLVKFFEAAEPCGIKPIIGAEVLLHNESDISKPYRLLLLCQNEIGYRNLTELISKSYIDERVEGQPVIQKEYCRAKNQGLIAILPEDSDVGMALKSGNTELAEVCIEYWTLVFKDRFYLEVTRIGAAKEEEYCQALIKLADKTECPIVATNNVRFIKKEDFEAHEARVCIHEGVILNDPNRSHRYTEEQYLKTPEEMVVLFKDLPEALENSVEIAKKCNVELQFGQVFLPDFPVKAGTTLEDYFREVAVAGLLKRFKTAEYEEIPIDYRDRLETEIKVINSMGFAGYFLIVADFIGWANDNGVPVGPGRGSGAGSLVAYALQITGMDPLQYDLLFERFLNPERVSMPDFDIDFCMEGRDRVIEYVANKYGRDSVSQIITFGTMAAKAVIRDVGRVLGHPYGFVDKIAKLVPLELGITLEKALATEDALKKLYQEEEEVKILIDLAKKLEGITKNAGKHAGGVVIAPRKLTDFTPLFCDAKEGDLLTQFDKNDVETIGLVKFDFLGLRTLTIIDWAMKTVNAERNKQNEAPIDINTIPLDDEKTFDLLRACNTTAVFQLESRGMKDLVKRLCPDNFEEIIQLGALFRPGPLQSGMVDDFINRKHGREVPNYFHPDIASILKPTYGIILYQEQVMQVAQVLAGYTLGSADLLRRAMGKKKPEEMAKQRAIFTEGAIKRGVPLQTATIIFDLMEKFAGYGFNKSHSAAYAMITYQTAWIKTHYPAAFMAAVLSSDMAHTDKMVIFIDECRAMKIHVCPPNINQSEYKFTVNEKKEILYGLGAIKGVGEAAIQNLIESRTVATFKDIFDLCTRIDTKKISRRTLEALIRAGALDCLGEHRAALMALLPEALLSAEQLARNRVESQRDLFGDSLLASDIYDSSRKVLVTPWHKTMVYEGEKETLGFYFSGHPLEEYEAELKGLSTTLIRDLSLDQRRVTIAGLILNIRTLLTKKGDKMAFLTLNDQTAKQEIAVFSDTYKLKRDLLVKDNLIFVEGELSVDEYSGGYKMRCIDLMSLEEARVKRVKYLKISLQEDSFSDEAKQHLSLALKQAKRGQTPVRINYQKTGIDSVLKLGEQWKVHPEEVLIKRLKKVCGEESVELCY